MKRRWIILVAGFAVGLAAYFGFYYLGTGSSRRLEQSQTPELAWLKAEFHLTDAEYQRVCQMHEGYLAGCAERCQQIDEKNLELKRLLTSATAVTPEIQKLLAQAAQLRAQCQAQMLEHFYQVSKLMPPDQGARYLAWVEARTVLASTHSQMTGQPPPEQAGHHH